MASILDKYGIKEVADVMFYEIDATGHAGKPVLYLDTLKVSNIEQTAQEATANGGKGNAPLIVWDYGKEITITLEDALFSAKSMALMFGDGDAIPATSTSGTLKKTISWTATSTTGVVPSAFEGPQGKLYAVPSTGIITYDASGSSMSGSGYNVTGCTVGEIYYTTFDMPITNNSTIEVSANTFPGTYYITGDTYARSEKTGLDEFFQFIIPKAKVQSSNTITLQADGDPSVFSLNLRVLRPAGGGAMMQLVKYDMAAQS